MYKTNLGALWFVSQPFRRRIVVMWFFIVLGNSLAYSVPYFFKRMADVAIEGNFTSLWDFKFALAGIVFCLIGQEISYRIGHIIETGILPGLFDRITSDLYYRLLQYPATFFEDRFTGALSSRVEQVGEAIKYLFEEFPWHIGSQMVALVVSLVLLSVAHASLFYTMLLWAVVFFALSYPLLRWQYRETQKLATSHASLFGNIVDAVGNITLVHSFSGTAQEHRHHRRYMGNVLQREQTERWVTVWNKLQQGLSVAVLGISLALVSAWLFLQQQITVTDLILVAAILPIVIKVVWQFGDTVVRALRESGAMRDALHSLLAEEPESQTGTAIRNSKGDLSFSNVTFAYPGTTAPVFSNFNLQITAGQKIGIVGISGAGKSTFVKLLLAQYAPQQGEITIGGQNISTIKLDSLRNAISLVPQDTTLFHRSLFENIHYAKPKASRQKVVAASKRAHAHEFIEDMPQGYETVVGERGVKLSGGQRQRIAIARAMLKDAPILILDEATSALDNESERIVQSGLHELFQNRTVIAIAHRLSTLREMDQVIVFDQGKIAEQGEPATLIAQKGGIFKTIWEQQKADFH